MEFYFDEIVNRSNTNCYKWDKLLERYHRDDLLPFWIADSEFRTAPPVAAALRERAEHGIFGYTFRPDRFYSAVENWFAQRHGWRTQRDWMVCTPGILTAIGICIESFSKPGAGVATLVPAYPGFYEKIEQHGRTLVTCECVLENGRYRIDFEDFEQRLRQNRCELFILCNPHNPTGRVWNRAELETLGEICLRNGVTIISDDIHCDIVYSGAEYRPIASLSKELEQCTITCSSPGKTFNLTGLATSIIFIPNEEYRKQFTAVLERYELQDGNLLGNLVAETAYAEGGAWADKLVEYLEGNCGEVLEWFRESDLPIVPVRPEGTFLLLLDCRGVEPDDDRLRELLVQQAGLVLNPGNTFGESTRGFVRFNFACPRELLMRGLERFQNIR